MMSRIKSLEGEGGTLMGAGAGSVKAECEPETICFSHGCNEIEQEVWRSC